MRNLRIAYSIVGLFLMLSTLNAQNIASGNRFVINADDLFETRWKYTYTYHPQSRSIIHQAGEEYRYFLHFKYNQRYEEFLNGKVTSGKWEMDGRTLAYSFKHIDEFKVASIDADHLILEFTQPNTHGTYQYHFVAVTALESPFMRPPNELPLVVIESEPYQQYNFTRKAKRPGFFARLFGRKNRKEDMPVQEELEYMNIELIGGGYYGGLDPVIKDFVHIKTDGRIIHEFKSYERGEVVAKANLTRAELEEFVEFIELSGFFDFPRVYDCNSSICQKRRRMEPKPTPLRIAVTKGIKKNVVTVPIYGSDGRGIRYIDYPAELDNIIEGIRRLSDRASGEMLISKK